MPIGKGYRSVIASQAAAGSLLASYTTAKSVINADALATIPANSLWVGQTLSLKIAGAISNRVTGPDTTTFQVMFGSIVIFTTGAITLTTTAHTTIPFWADILLTCRALGSGTSANWMGQARLSGIMFQQTGAAAVDATNGPTFCMPNTAPAVGTGFDSTAANLLDFWVAQSFSGSGNGIQIHQYVAALET
jgi:hypothetical protein